MKPTIQIVKPCPDCAGELLVRVNGKTGHEFIGCANWPKCNYTEEIPESIKLRAMGAATLPGFE